ncbi:class I SAM-dependent methyltransferase (plasmid) [Acidovorax sp. DW039]|uniref:class I SAM-dependent methyltransferase n=1 Tax=Acidovorax sp. DW039 TaxID=3095606 RepID=UPI0030936272|nr:class I SAM-dependent methyltransferase [Acidovorax sp. DW039]
MIATIHAARAKGYINESVYPAHFHREIMPVWIQSTLIALGRAAPSLQSSYRWLELGCGNGISAVVAAATNPLGHFVAIDANPNAIEQARALAQLAGVTNVEFHCETFEQALSASQHSAPAYDFIVSHGVYSWVSRATRKSVHAIVHALLKPGGILYLSYASQPGSASAASAYKLMSQVASLQGGDCVQRTEYAVGLIDQLTRAGAGYLREQPRVAQEILHLAGLDINYTAHESISPHWESLHCADVIAEFEAIDCSYAGSAARIENIDAASVPQKCQPLLEELKNQGASIATQETFKDIVRNQSQRRDLFQRNNPSENNLLPPEIHRKNLLSQRVCLLQNFPNQDYCSNKSLRISTRIGPLEIPMELIHPLLLALKNGPMTYAELTQLARYKNQPGQINQLLQCLSDAGWIHYVRPDARDIISTETPSLLPLNRELSQLPVGVPPRNIKAIDLIGGSISIDTNP